MVARRAMPETSHRYGVHQSPRGNAVVLDMPSEPPYLVHVGATVQLQNEVHSLCCQL